MKLNCVLVMHAHLYSQLRIVETEAEVLQFHILYSQGLAYQQGEFTKCLVLLDSDLGHFKFLFWRRRVPNPQLKVEQLLFYLLLFFYHLASFSINFLH